MCKISVIVPVYNTEKYLEKCLDSLVNQTMNNIEIIVVNDGSIDHSEDIIKKYEEKYKNMIKYYKKENGGLSSARNYGISKAKGKYITFVDSDDYLDINLFSKLEKYIQKDIDLIKYKTIKIYENKKQEKFEGPVFEQKNGQEAFDELYSKDVLLEPAWLYLYKREFWNKNNFKYKVNTYHEDFGLTPLIIVKSESVVSTNIYGYYYMQRQNSIVTDTTKNIKKAYDLLIHYDNMIKKINELKINEKTKENIKIYYTNAILLNINNLNKKDYKNYKKEIKKRKMIKNIKVRNFKQLIKKILLLINIKIYLKLR